jgi:hypothetical protein
MKLANRAWDEKNCQSQIIAIGKLRPASSLPSTASGGRIY